MTDTPRKRLPCQRFWIEQVAHVDREGTRNVREVVRHPGSVVILPLFDDGGICLIKNYRVAVKETLLD